MNTETMRIGKVIDLTEVWIKLAAIREENMGLWRTSYDHIRERKIFYGVKPIGQGGFEFRVEDAVTGEDLTAIYMNCATAGTFIKELNLTRALRPGGGSLRPGRQIEVPPGFDACRFGCGDQSNPISLSVRRVAGVLHPGDIKGLDRTWKIFPNLTPFEPNGQFLIVQSKNDELPHTPQYLTEDVLGDMIAMCKASQALVIFFNSLHGGASVDHFHLQAVYKGNEPLPILAYVKDNPGIARLAKDFPINGLTFGPQAYQNLWGAVQSLQKQHVPFNLIYLGPQFVLIPRDVNNEIVREFGSVLASMELCGRFILSDEETFKKTAEGDIVTALGRIRLSCDEIARLVGYDA